jgi:hypothetical protein
MTDAETRQTLDLCKQLRDPGQALLVADHAADVIEALYSALQWFIENDDTNQGDNPQEHLGGRSWDDVNAYWIDGLNAGIAAVKLAEGRQ